MYCSHFGFRMDPFGVTPDPRFFVALEQYGEAVALLQYALHQRRGFAALVGPAGVGKTSVLAVLAERIAPEALVAFLGHSRIDSDTVLESLLISVGIEPEASLARQHRQLQRVLLDLHNLGKSFVLLLDEAQQLNRDSLEAIRMLSNFETSREKLIQIVLSGQPQLNGLMSEPENRQTLQRINLVARLNTLNPVQIQEYVIQRIRIAGGSPNVFTPAALKGVAKASLGVPRVINTICFNALTSAFSREQDVVEERDIEDSLQNLRLIESFELTAAPGVEPDHETEDRSGATLRPVLKSAASA